MLLSNLIMYCELIEKEKKRIFMRSMSSKYFNDSNPDYSNSNYKYTSDTTLSEALNITFPNPPFPYYT